MSRPTLVIQTVYFHPSDRPLAQDLGGLLYEHLTRPRADRLAFGGGIPVLIATDTTHVDTDVASHLLIVPVLGASSFRDEDCRQVAKASVQTWHQHLGPGHVVPVFASANWRSEESEFPGKSVLTRLYSDQDGTWTNTLIEVVLAACRLLAGPALSLRLFISHAKRDLAGTGDVAALIRDFAKSATTGLAFFDTTDLEPGHDLAHQLATATQSGVFVAIHSDTYAARSWCQRELQWAKENALPTLTVEVMKAGEPRSYPYSGNGPTLTWRDSPPTVVLQAFIEWLKAAHFKQEAERMAHDLPQHVVLTRPPELFDLAFGKLRSKGPRVVLHPDPELSANERQVLREARPRLRLVTPRTLFRRLTPSDTVEPQKLPLYRRQIALSLSDSPAANGDAGFTSDHIDDAITYLARSIVAAGGAIAYGGDFRSSGFDELLAELVVAYNESGVDRADYLHSYLAALIPSDKIPEDLALTDCSLNWTPRFAKLARLSWPDEKPGAHRSALYFSDMRRVMGEAIFARVALAGQDRPRSSREPGYGGPFPGVVEEAWRALEQRKPLYVVGGFGGAAALVAELLTSDETPLLMRRETFGGEEYSEFQERCDLVVADPDTVRLGLPPDMAALSAAVRAFGKGHLASDAASLAWNGLTVVENEELFRTRDPVAITQLVMKGLLACVAKEDADKLKIELVCGSITQAEEADAIAIAAFDDVRIGGAGASLDAMLSYLVTSAVAQREQIVDIESPDIDAEWLVIPDLGSVGAGDLSPIPEAIERAAAGVANIATRHQFRRIAVVAFGGTVVDLSIAAERMIRGFRDLHTSTVIQWFELDPGRFDDLRQMLESQDNVALSTRVLPSPPLEETATSRDRDLVVTVRYEGGHLHTTLLPPAGTAAAVACVRPLAMDAFADLAKSDAPRAPTLGQLDAIGEKLAEALFDEAGHDLFGRGRLDRVLVQHDLDSAPLPFEALRVADHRFALEKGLVRRPALTGLSLGDITRLPQHSGSLNVLLVVNPTEDLAATEVEGDAVKRALLAMGESIVRVTELRGPEATKERVLAALTEPTLDVLHYSGHAFYDGPGPDGSGLWCSSPTGPTKLLLVDIAQERITPRITFFNGCQSARLRNRTAAESARAFAEFFLRSGVEAYIGTTWPVADDAAASFATSVYAELAGGATLDAAVRSARQQLAVNGEPDWANYVLYGDGSFRLVTSR